MNRYKVKVMPHSSLFIGGYTHNSGVSHGDTARDPAGSFIVPGSVIKGALREAATRLVNGADPDWEKEGRRLVKNLFGQDFDDTTAEETEGKLRIGELRPPEGFVLQPTLRHHVSLERETRQSSSQRLFQNQVTPAGSRLTFSGELELLESLSAEEENLLTAAVEVTDQIGGGRGRGLGLVEMTLTLSDETSEEPMPDVELTGDGVQTIVLELTAMEPLRLGVIKDGTNVLDSKDYLDGSVVRGAVAAVLKQQGDAMELVLGGPDAVVFGDARPGSEQAIPAPMTLRLAKRAEGAEADAKREDLAVKLCAETYCGRNFEQREAKGTVIPDEKGQWEELRPKRRLVTRSARNHLSGRSQDRRLFSLELLDPLQVSDEGKKPHRLRFYAPVTGTAEQLRAVIGAASRGLLVGGVRSRGFGRVSLTRILTDPVLPPLAERHRAWAEAVRRAKGEGPDPETTAVLLALGPISLDGPTLIDLLGKLGLRAFEGRTRRHIHGGWNRKVALPRLLSGCFLPGSTWIVRSRDPRNLLATLERLETQGLGPGRPDGWGRLVVCHPIHLEHAKENEPCKR